MSVSPDDAHMVWAQTDRDTVDRNGTKRAVAVQPVPGERQKRKAATV